MSQDKFYITSAIAYASRKPHFGNTYEIILTDALARFQRQMGKDVFFLTGTDEHGQKIEELAKAANILPKKYVDNVSDEIKGIWNMMGASYDHFIRTTDDYHETAVEHIFETLYKKGDIYKGEYEGWYCTPCESFFTDTQATNGKCPDCGREVTRAKEEAYFFAMSKYADRLIKYIEDNPDFIQPESRKKEMVNNFLKAGLQDLCVSRTSFTWGIPVSFDPKHIVYVWIDALSNYITALGYDPYNEVQPELFQKYWPADVHIIGKDILRFHTIYWPIMLMALDLPLPKKVFGHPWFNFGADKMSKSRGNVIYADRLAEFFGTDGVRYYALSEMPYNSDGSITYENVVARYNGDLANNLGNLVSRTHAMTCKYFDGIIPVPADEDAQGYDDSLRTAVIKAVEDSCTLTSEYRIADALESIFDMFKRSNKYIDETAPWVLAKDESNKSRLGTVLYNLLEAIRIGAVLLEPFMPETSKKILDQLATDTRDYESTMSFGNLESGRHLGTAETLFARIDEAKFLAEREAEMLAARKAAEAAEKEKEEPEHEPTISIDDFMKVELRCAKVIECEKVQKSKKLLRLTVDLGYEKRQIVSGIALFYTPEQLIGKKVVIVTNLAPAKLCGIESQGMLLAAGEDDVKVLFPDESTPLGARVH